MLKKIKKLQESQKPLTIDLIGGIITALLFSAFIYLEHFGITLKLLNTLFGIISLALLLYMSKRAVLIAGFFIGLLWFYWIGYSFEYNGVGYLTPVITLIFAFIYMLFFGILALTNKVYIRAILLFALSFFEPADWNWMQIELVFVDSYIGVLKYQLIVVLIALSLPNYIKNKYKYTPLLLILAALNFNPQIQKDAPLKIKLVSTDITQDVKWKRETLAPTIKMAQREIKDAIKNNYDVVVLPESVFPLFMNQAPKLVQKLLLLSKDITIIAGSLLNEDNQHYNVTYMFTNGNLQVAKKLVLVPFGEYIPLPKFIKKFVNDTFFAGASDFKTATEPTDFIIKGVKFRNAICYEATCQEIYEGDVDFVIAISNNAWFSPSIEPTLQKLLMRFYARKNGVTIYHSANYKGTGIIK
ncbi:MAG: apolipoprotein N-acyltransferase [Sulfurimonas sp.]|uniref:apolipoprotein N-acyltransferase n=1 Tax=Sulfurimonas sp. TaxID=2022749 RepID=UPI00262224FE|nr:apolipoprotein N-acyltransferase [Sulfurimonas sp.]MCW8895914.1 apolipoprotein N-acyltransferase [Sulfurimonas sp.]MCW8954486.1 apolipoprotein N-acyltransferase [Sulfurimonas sp.]MCW9067894.1 apolipoprotein N-acyltransferase [Sulfurimonas sp.]